MIVERFPEFPDCLFHVIVEKQDNMAGCFNLIPCGINNKGVTSLSKLLEKTIRQQEVRQKLIQHYSEVFNLRTREITLEEIAQRA